MRVVVLARRFMGNNQLEDHTSSSGPLPDTFSTNKLAGVLSSKDVRHLICFSYSSTGSGVAGGG